MLSRKGNVDPGLLFFNNVSTSPYNCGYYDIDYLCIYFERIIPFFFFLHNSDRKNDGNSTLDLNQSISTSLERMKIDVK